MVQTAKSLLSMSDYIPKYQFNISNIFQVLKRVYIYNIIWLFILFVIYIYIMFFLYFIFIEFVLILIIYIYTTNCL